MKPIRISNHALGYCESRGFTVEEIEEAIRACPWEPAEAGRLECRQNLPFEREWKGKWYATKQLRPIFAEDADSILVVTVYTYYF